MKRRLSALAVLLAPPLLGAAPQPLAIDGLPATVNPLHYDITIDPDPTALAFAGREVITVAVAEATRTIVLNAAELAIGAVTLDGTVKPATVATDEAKQTLTLAFEQPVAPGTHRLAIAFRGKINRSAAGLFAVDYKDEGGADRRMLVTQLEPSDGRRVAPMWDAPARKATFRVAAVTPAGQSSFSNMPVESTAPAGGGRTLVTFRPSPKMSSYLLFLGQGDVERRTRTVGATEIGIITRRGALDQGDYALDSAARLLAYFNDYFGTPYPLPKLDMIAAPGSSQFFSAMENWGAILYFDRAVLVDPRTTTESQRQYIFNVVAHEMAHQWFGNLVTMRWWDDLWLNEGFASWMASKVSDALNPEWNVAAQEVAGSRQAAFTVDARLSTHPIIQKIETVDQISQAFDTITYEKGQAVIRMLEGSVGADPFRAAVRSYMAKHSYRNTVTDDLLAEVSAAAGRDVKPFMDSFTRQGGVPLIRAGEPRCADRSTNVSLSQGRFALDGSREIAQRWLIPVDLASAGRAVATIGDTSAVKGRVPGCAPLVINPGQYGYYRVLHAPRNFDTLARGFGSLQLSDQIGLMGDALALASGGYAGLDRYLGLVDRLPANAHPLVWDFAGTQLGSIARILADDPALSSFKARARALLAPQFARVGFTPAAGEAPPTAQLRETLIEELGLLGDPALVEGVRKLVAAGLDAIPAAIRQPAIATFAYNATPAEWELLHKAAIAERNPIAQRGFYEALGATRDPALAERTLAIALTDEATVPNRAELIRGVASLHPALAFGWAVRNAAAVNALIEASSRASFIVTLAGSGTDPALAQRVEDYAEAHLPADARGDARSTVSTIRSRAGLRALYAGPAARWAAR